MKHQEELAKRQADESAELTKRLLNLYIDALRTAGAPDSGDPVELMEWAENVRKRSEPRFVLFTSHEFYPDTSTVKLCGIFEHVNDALIKGRSEEWYEVIDAKTLEVVEDSFDNVKLPLTDETGAQP